MGTCYLRECRGRIAVQNRPDRSPQLSDIFLILKSTLILLFLFFPSQTKAGQKVIILG